MDREKPHIDIHTRYSKRSQDKVRLPGCFASFHMFAELEVKRHNDTEITGPRCGGKRFSFDGIYVFRTLNKGLRWISVLYLKHRLH